MKHAKKENIWETLTLNIDFENLVKSAESPCEFQLELKAVLDFYCKDHFKIIEVGSFSGITSLILDDRFDKTLLDSNHNAVMLSESIFEHYGKKATFVTGDMFNMPFPNGYFDVVFNAGVLEHFMYEDRVRALREYARVLKNSGEILVAFPNHYSAPYKLAYRYLTRNDQWKYPKEVPLYDLKNEVRAAGLILSRREVKARKTAFHYLSLLPRHWRYVLYPLFKMLPCEGYLTIVKIRKSKN